MPVVPDLDMWRDLWEILILCRNALELVRINEKGQEEEISVSRSQFRVKVKSLSCVRLFATPWTVSLPGSSGGGKSTGVGCHFLLQGIFPTQGSNPCLPHCKLILYQLSHKRSPSIYILKFNHSLIAGHLGKFQLLATMNKTAINICVQIFMWT